MATIANPTVPMVHRKPVASYSSVNAYQPVQQHAVNAPRTSPSAYPNPPSPYSAPSQSRRTLSNATSSTSSTTNMARQSTGGYPNSIRRSTSSRSNTSASPTSYVALMRKQKATVWCDRAQHQDPRILAAQRQAKMRAVMEVAGGHNHNPQATRVSTSSSGIAGGVRSKIRHHGAPKAKDYGGNMSGAGVPMRLSATEVDEDESEDEKAYHRASSSRSSMGSSSRPYGYSSYRGYGNDASPPNAISPDESLGDVAEEETPMPGRLAGQSDYFGGASNAETSSISDEKSFGVAAGLPRRERSDSQHMSADELRRRGSVDDRTMTMSAGRLFVANPDLSD